MFIPRVFTNTNYFDFMSLKNIPTISKITGFNTGLGDLLPQEDLLQFLSPLFVDEFGGMFLGPQSQYVGSESGEKHLHQSLED